MGNIVDRLLGKVVYLDANIFIYAIEEPKSIKLYIPFIKQLFQSIDKGKVTAITSELTLSEVLVGAYGRFPELIDIYNELISSSDFLKVYSIDREILKQSALLRSLHKISLADAIHVTTAIIHNADIIITNDKKMSVPNELEKITFDEVI